MKDTVKQEEKTNMQNSLYQRIASGALSPVPGPDRCLNKHVLKENAPHPLAVTPSRREFGGTGAALVLDSVGLGMQPGKVLITQAWGQLAHLGNGLDLKVLVSLPIALGPQTPISHPKDPSSQQGRRDRRGDGTDAILGRGHLAREPEETPSPLPHPPHSLGTCGLWDHPPSPHLTPLPSLEGLAWPTATRAVKDPVKPPSNLGPVSSLAHLHLFPCFSSMTAHPLQSFLK